MSRKRKDRSRKGRSMEEIRLAGIGYRRMQYLGANLDRLPLDCVKRSRDAGR